MEGLLVHVVGLRVADAGGACDVHVMSIVLVNDVINVH